MLKVLCVLSASDHIICLSSQKIASHFSFSCVKSEPNPIRQSYLLSHGSLVYFGLLTDSLSILLVFLRCVEYWYSQYRREALLTEPSKVFKKKKKASSLHRFKTKKRAVSFVSELNGIHFLLTVLFQSLSF